ncbi:cytochrome c oxidase assembly protein COX16 homolog, mitochondrial isoform 1-T1 [Anomaloglossus baeobatrachus]|uniref:cytochrome c oxidase assembly protein COX16 homolog, mitochondrial isoform X1 n=1 Tax=Anomaloglossus baeobatrachus TaxID=238106 RepID=UPI003F50321D
MLEKLWLSCKNNPTLRYGVPMLLLVIGGSFGLREFTQIRYDVQKLKNTVDPSVAGVIKNKDRNVTLESEYEIDLLSYMIAAPRQGFSVLMKKSRIHPVDKRLKEKSFDEWKNIRGPRPWEDSKSYQDHQRMSITKDT